MDSAIDAIVECDLQIVWGFITQKENWQKWWGGDLQRLEPGWQTGAWIFWGNGDSSIITNYLKMREIQITSTWLERTFRFYALENGKTRIEVGFSPRGGASFSDGGEAHKKEMVSTLSRLKKCVEGISEVKDQIVESASPSNAPSISVSPAAGNDKAQFSDDEWITLQCAIYWIFRQLFLIHRGGDIDKLTEAQKKALGNVLQTVPVIKSPLARQVLLSLTEDRDMFIKVWSICFMDPRHPADGLQAVSEVLDGKLPADISLEFKRTLLILGKFIDLEHEKLAGKNPLEKPGALSQSNQCLILAGSSLKIPDKELMGDLFGTAMNIFDLPPVVPQPVKASSVSVGPVVVAANTETGTDPLLKVLENEDTKIESTSLPLDILKPEGQVVAERITAGGDDPNKQSPSAPVPISNLTGSAQPSVERPQKRPSTITKNLRWVAGGILILIGGVSLIYFLSDLLKPGLAPAPASIPASATSIPLTPTQIPPTPTAILADGPKDGHWEGIQPYVSFDVIEGDIVNFVLSAPFVADKCTLNIEKIPVKENKFLVDAKTANKQEASIGIFVIQGNFNGEDITGTHKIEFCGRTIAFYPEEKPWKASWKGEPTLPTSIVPQSTPVVINPAPQSEPSQTPFQANTEITFLSQFQPTTVELGYGTYSVGKFQFTSGDPGDHIKYGDPIILRGVEYPNGIFAHAPSRLVYNLGSQHFAKLFATIGLVQKISCGDGAIFIVLLDRKELFRSKVLTASSIPVEIQVPLTTGSELTLSVSSGAQSNNGCDWAIWGDPRLR